MSSNYVAVPQKESDCSAQVTDLETCCSPSQNRKDKLQRLFLVISSLSILVTCAFIVGMLNTLRARFNMATNTIYMTGATEHLPSSNSPGMIHMQYGNRYEYMSLDNQYDYLWDNFTARAAVVRLHDVKITNDDREQKIGSIAMLHQLHCLSGIRKALQSAQSGVDIGIDYHDNDHWPHCLDYLRQSILCAADSTLELPGPYEGAAKGSIDGAFDVRTCRDAQPLFDWHDRDGLK